MTDKIGTGNRIKEFAIKNYGSLTAFSKAMGMKVQGLYPYVNAKCYPGAILLLRMKNLGCSSDWVLSGEKSQSEITIENIKKLIEDNGINKDSWE